MVDCFFNSHVGRQHVGRDFKVIRQCPNDLPDKELFIAAAKDRGVYIWAAEGYDERKSPHEPLSCVSRG